MTVSPVSTTMQTYQNPALRNNLSQFQQEFQQLGEDLQSGNLSAAQSDMGTLQQLEPSGSSPTNNLISQELNQLSEQVQGGNLTGAQQDYGNLQNNLERQAARFHHHQDPSGTPSSPVDNELLQLGQSAQVSSQSSAQQAYSNIQTNLLPPIDLSSSGTSGTSFLA
jgi:hypothetical protein